MNKLFILMTLLSCSFIAIAQVDNTKFSDFYETKDLITLESVMQLKLQKSIEQVDTDVKKNIYVSIDLKRDRSLLSEKVEASDFDYLPLSVTDSIRSNKKSILIKEVEVRISSEKILSLKSQRAIKEIIQSQISNLNPRISFRIYQSTGMKLNSINTGVGIFLVICLFGLLWMLTLKGKRFFNRKHSSGSINSLRNLDTRDLVSFVKRNLSVNRDAISSNISDTPKDIKGIITLIPYLENQFSIDEIFKASTRYKCSLCSEGLSSIEFKDWLKVISEKITVYNLKNSKASSAFEEICSESTKNTESWNQAILFDLPTEYLMGKLSGLDDQRILDILSLMEDTARYIIISNLSQNRSEKIMLKWGEHVNTNSDALSELLDGFKKDFESGVFEFYEKSVS